MRHQEYLVKRKLQEQSGSYFVILPKLWVESLNLKEGDFMSVKFNGGVKIDPLKETFKKESLTERE
jgi:hypothetical protein